MHTSRSNPIGYSPGGNDTRAKQVSGQLIEEKQTLCKWMNGELQRRLKENDTTFTRDQVNQIYIVCLETSGKIDKASF